jgi:hypothetical protein
MFRNAVAHNEILLAEGRAIEAQNIHLITKIQYGN